MRIKFLLFAILINSIFASAQDFSNKGKDFWLGYGYHVSMVSGTGVPLSNGGSQVMRLYLTSDVNATVTVEIPAVGYSKNYNVSANQVTISDPLPSSGSQDCRISDTGYFNRGIHIFSTAPIVAYAHIYNSSISGASLLFPTNTLGQEYYAISFTQASNATYANNFFFVVATEDNTTVEITPSAANKNNKPAGVPFNVTLNKGQIYSVFGTTSGNAGTDLTGSKIRSVNVGTSGCKRIAVFSGAGKMSIGVSTAGGSGTPTGSADNLFAQAFPSNAWGKRYLTSPTGSQPNNFYRVCVKDPTTVVKLNGTIIPSSSLINGFYYQFRNSSASVTTSAATPNLIEADKSILVAQYCTTQGKEGNPNTNPGGDPEMIFLSPVEQTINKITLYSADSAKILQSYINVIIKNGGIASFKLDGVSMASSFQLHPRDANYSYATFSVSSHAAHSLYSDTGFNAIAYGFGSAESYGYNAGTNVIDLYQYVTIQNQYATVNFPSTCKGTPFKFSITLPYQPISLLWDFGSNPNLTPSTSVSILPPSGQTLIPADSSFIKDGRTLYVYKLTQDYTFTAAGTYSIKVSTNNPTPDGCSGLQEINYDVQVFDQPKADFTFTHTGCVTDSVHFFDATNGYTRPTIKWKWEFGDNTVDSVKNPIKFYTSPGTGTYNIKLTSYTDIGCVTDTTKAFAISSVPIAKFGVSDTTCVGKTIVISDSSSIVVGTIVKWYWDYGNGIKDTLTTNTVPRTQVYNTPGTFTITLIVESNTGCKSVVASKQITIHVNPIVDFSLPIACLPVGAAQFSNLTTMSDGTIATTTYVWNFGDATNSTATNPLHNYTTTGPFTVKLTAASQYGCVKDSSKVLTTVYPQPHTTISIMPYVCLRDTTIVLSFTDNLMGSNVTIVKHYWNYGDGTTLDSINPKHKYTNPGTYTVKYWSLTNAGCLSDTSVTTTIVNPLPTADFITQATLNYCENRPITFIDKATDASITTGVTLNKWYWDFNDGTTLLPTGGFNTSLLHNYNSYGVYNVKMMVQNSIGCKSDTISKVVDIHPLPHVGFMIPEVCLADAAAVFTDTTSIADGSQSSFIYKWTFNVTGVTPGPTPATSTVKNGSTKYNKSDNYQVKLKVTSNVGCVDSLTTAFTVNGSIPKSDFNVLNPTGLCSNLPVQILNTSTVDFGWLTKVEIYWDYANNPTAKVIDDTPTVGKIYNNLYPNFQQPATKTFTIRFVAYSGGTCVDIKTKTITLNASPKTQFVTMPGICFDANPRQITQASEIGGVSGASPAFAYYGTGVNSTGLYNPNIAGAGTYPIKYVYTSDKGCQDSSIRNITVWPSPTAKFGISSPVCEKNDITFTDSSLANFSNIISWNYDFGDATTLIRNNATPFIKKYLLGNTYNATLKVTTDSGCVSPIFSLPIKVNYLPIVDFALPDICLPDGRGTFNNLSTIPDATEALFSYVWDFGDPNNLTPSVLKSPIHQYTALAPTGGYSVKLKIVSNNGCIDSLTKQFSNVYPQPSAKFKTTPLNGEVCIGDTLFFTDLSDGKTSAVNTWNWNFGDNTSSSIQNPFKKYSDTGSFEVKLVIFNTQGCISDTAKRDSVIIHPYPKLNAGPDLFVLEGGTIQLKPSFYAINPSFLWTTVTYPVTYLDFDTIAYPKSSPPDDITYIVKLTGIGGCTVMDDVFIKVLKAPLIPNAFSPNGDGNHDFWEIEYLESYPGATIDVFDRSGRLVFNSVGYSVKWDGKLNGQPLPVGTYYYIINPKNGRNLMSGSITIIR